MNRTTQLIWLAVILLALVGAPACKQTVRGGSSKPPLARCMEDLDNIPELAALRARDKDKPQEATGKPLEGLEVALTINDQVRATSDPNDVDNWCEHEDSRENFDRLVAALREHQMPPTVDFAVGQALDPEIARAWISSGNRLGNLTYSRKKPNKTSAEEFINDITRNEQTIAPYRQGAAAPLKYFRFPRMKNSLEPEARTRIDKYLRDNGYTLVPATIDARDETFNWIYCSAMARKDESCVALLKAYFKSLLLDTTLRARESARQVAGREVKHILVIKADQLICDTLAELLTWYKSLGARFIPLEEALRDPFYAMIDSEGKPISAGLTRAIKHAQSDSGQKK